jgi:hypothetical protein
MIFDNALARFSVFKKILDDGDTSKRGAEHRNFLLLRFTHQNVRFRSVLELVEY